MCGLCSTHVLASILTTCAAFVPLMFFEGFFGKLVSYIPLIVILMLIASLLESVLILPAHMSAKNKILDSKKEDVAGHWFHRIEKKYENFLMKVLSFRVWILGFLIFLLGTSAYLYKTQMKFVMFPREESKEVFIKIKADKSFLRYETAKAIEPLEMMFVKDKDNVVAVRSSIGLSRRGSEARENEASILVELIPANNRPTPLDVLLKNWEEKSKGIEGLESVRFLRGRWGHSSGSAVEIQVQENDDKNRDAVVKFIESKLKEDKDLTDVEVEKPLLKNEYMIQLNQKELSRLNVNSSAVTTTLRSFVEGSILYDINKGNEEVTVKLSVPDKNKSDLEELLKLKVKNSTGQLIYLKNVVSINNIKKPVSIQRSDFKRSTMIYANPVKGSKVTPLQIAERLEENVFPEIINKFPTSVLKFKGEIEDSRESQGQFQSSIMLVFILIFMILMVVFNSAFKPILVLSVVPFGLVGVVITLFTHGMTVYGFFAAIGALGMIGVVINDAIVMVDKLDKAKEKAGRLTYQNISQVASTRLRPILVTTLTTVVGVLPTAYGIAGYDSMLAEMMLVMGWGLVFGTIITLIYIPIIYTISFKKS
ncbi:MAG: efflux RND transporter permease subunit [Oligoflexia bacterium]|nr:efflux RND transporter permease subunit [Oligoflexia bacterium]